MWTLVTKNSSTSRLHLVSLVLEVTIVTARAGSATKALMMFTLINGDEIKGDVEWLSGFDLHCRTVVSKKYNSMWSLPDRNSLYVWE